MKSLWNLCQDWSPPSCVHSTDISHHSFICYFPCICWAVFFRQKKENLPAREIISGVQTGDPGFWCIGLLWMTAVGKFDEIYRVLNLSAWHIGAGGAFMLPLLHFMSPDTDALRCTVHTLCLQRSHKYCIIKRTKQQHCPVVPTNMQDQRKQMGLVRLPETLQRLRRPDFCCMLWY